MKLKFNMIISMLFMSGLYAASVNEQIEAIRNAPPEERVAMMNRLKMQIAAMNEEERIATLEALQKNTSSHGNRLQLRLRQGNFQEGGTSLQQLRLQNIQTPKQFGKQ